MSSTPRPNHRPSHNISAGRRHLDSTSVKSKNKSKSRLSVPPPSSSSSTSASSSSSSSSSYSSSYSYDGKLKSRSLVSLFLSLSKRRLVVSVCTVIFIIIAIIVIEGESDNINENSAYNAYNSIIRDCNFKPASKTNIDNDTLSQTHSCKHCLFQTCNIDNINQDQENQLAHHRHHHQQQQHHSRIKIMAAFSWFAHVPVDLGDVLELTPLPRSSVFPSSSSSSSSSPPPPPSFSPFSSSSHPGHGSSSPLFLTMLHVQPRAFTSYTAWTSFNQDTAETATATATATTCGSDSDSETDMHDFIQSMPERNIKSTTRDNHNERPYVSTHECPYIYIDQHSSITSKSHSSSPLSSPSSSFASSSSSLTYSTIILMSVLSSSSYPLAVLASVYSSLSSSSPSYLLLYERSVSAHALTALRAVIENYFVIEADNDERVWQRLAALHQGWGNDAQDLDQQNQKHENGEHTVFYVARKKTLEELRSVVRPSFRFVDSFYMLWATGSLHVWRLHVIDSIFAQHPNCTVHIYTEQTGLISDTILRRFANAGLSLIVHDDFKPTNFFKNTPLESWSSLHYNHYNYRVHVSDAFRLAAPWLFGGVYIDFDYFLFRPLNSPSLPLRNMISHETFPGLVNGALLIGDQHHPFIQLAMIHFVRIHNITIWHSSGPILQTKIVELYNILNTNRIRTLEKPTEQDHLDTNWNVYHPSSFYPMRWESAKDRKYWKSSDIDMDELTKFTSQSYGLHIWTAMVGPRLTPTRNYIDPKNFYGQVMLRTCRVLCQDLIDNNPLDEGEYYKWRQ